jgi:GTP-binding protein
MEQKRKSAYLCLIERKMEIRNIAIIAHIDHGKTSLTDALMRQTGVIKEGASMDSNVLEKERGITIYSKNTFVFYRGTKINIVDTPGHADFGSEVERVLRSVDSVLLVIDAQEGPMPQTKFVLKKSLELGLKPIVVINKIDKPAARFELVKDEILGLFMELGANDQQLNFTTVYSIAKDGIAKLDLNDDSKDLSPLLDVIIKEVPVASSQELSQKMLKIQPFNLGFDNFMGRLAIVRIYQGTIRPNINVFIKKTSGQTRTGKITKIFTFNGSEKQEIDQATAGDIIMIAGLPDIYIGETICADPSQQALPAINIDEPTISLDFLVNNSPFGGKEGKFLTSRQLQERLKREAEVNVGLKIDFSLKECFKVYGRGELHIAILLENMRRDGYELQVSRPQVIIKEENKIKLEPFEEVIIDIPNEMAGVVIEGISKRKGIMKNMRSEQSRTIISFEIPTRGFLGYRGEFITNTRGEGMISNQVIGFKPFLGEIKHRTVGSMISMANGKSFGFSLWNLQERGELYIEPGTEVYEGMVIGNVSKGKDMTVNPTKGKELTNMRTKGADEAIKLTPAIKITLEKGLEIMGDDEYLEITPLNIRLRKKILKEVDRIRFKRSSK